MQRDLRILTEAILGMGVSALMVPPKGKYSWPKKVITTYRLSIRCMCKPGPFERRAVYYLPIPENRDLG